MDVVHDVLGSSLSYKKKSDTAEHWNLQICWIVSRNVKWKNKNWKWEI